MYEVLVANNKVLFMNECKCVQQCELCLLQYVLSSPNIKYQIISTYSHFSPTYMTDLVLGIYSDRYVWLACLGSFGKIAPIR